MVPLLSVVVPCHNEAATLEELCRQVEAACAGVIELEMVVVNDGSKDETLSIARGIAAANPHVRLLSFSRNFGKEAAMLAGLRASTGDAVIIMDGDLQHPPSLIPDLVKGWLVDGFDQVLAQRDRTGDPWLRSQVSKLYYRMVNALMDVKLQDGVGDFRLMSRRVVDAILGLCERNRFSKGLFAWVGFPSTTITYTNVVRTAGESSWSGRALLNYGIDGVLSFNSQPLRLAIHLGLWSFLVFVAYAVWLVISRFFTGIEMPGYITTIAVIVGVGGLQVLFLGVIGEYIGRIYYEVKARPVYILAEDSSAGSSAGSSADSAGSGGPDPAQESR